MRIHNSFRQFGAPLRKQKGVVMVIALIVLVCMTLAAIGMSRSIDTGNLVAGNLAFKQATISSADLGIASAYTWLSSNSAGTALQNSDGTNGYYSSSPGVEPNWYDMSNWGSAFVINGGVPDNAGNVVRYVVHRMCTEPNTSYNGSNSGVVNQCALTFPTGGAISGGSMSVGSTQFQGIPQLYYRVTVRVDGPHSTVSVVQMSILIQV